ncbi:MAG: DNA repair protein RadA [Phycisphaeraceae bacterium]|nr:DNA repair protein RadA [Phycisphaeraceae bacterium]
MAKVRQMYVCRTCGGVQTRWMGKCPECGAWDALEEHREEKSAGRDPQRGVVEGIGAGVGGGGVAAWGAWEAIREGARPEDVGIAGSGGARPIAEVARDGGAGVARISTGIGELDRVLGGGLVAGSVVLVGGDPGIGKSTLMLQAAGKMPSRRGEGTGDGAGARVLYVSSEESAEQVRLRAARLGVDAAPGLFVLADTNLARVVEQVRRVEPAVVVIDSVQMVYKADVDAAAGSVTQLRRVCAELVYLAKLTGIAVVLVGHVTKDGQLAGPRLLEHLVDAVLYFEGDRYHAHRVIRGVKNRFGTTLEIGLFEMTGEGLREVPEGMGVGVLGAGEARPGTVVCPVMTGTRCVMVEVQALTATGFLGAAKRKSSGLDANRLAMIIAVLEQHAGLRLADRDIFASSVGGIRVAEPAADLALLLAIAGAHYKKSLPAGTVAVGEVGLGGEVRSVTQVEQRVKEAARLGFGRVIVPGRGKSEGKPKSVGGVEVVRVKSVGEAMGELG